MLYVDKLYKTKKLDKITKNNFPTVFNPEDDIKYQQLHQL